MPFWRTCAASVRLVAMAWAAGQVRWVGGGELEGDVGGAEMERCCRGG